MTKHSHDAIVIGGGPAGSTAAALLASKGRRTLLLEREKFPRYHIGESLIPYTYFPLERIGVIDKMKASNFPHKHSVQFVRQSGEVSQPYYFFQHMEHDAARTWQVSRAEFDLMLLDNAREKGAEALEETRVTETISEGGATVGVRAVGKDGRPLEFRAPVTIDASGRDALAMLRNRWRARDPELNKIAIWTYYRGALRDPGLDAGATTVAYVPHKGWFWYIPLSDDLTSVGLVAEKEYLYRDSRDPETIFQNEISRNRWIEQHLAPGLREGPYRVTAEFSYRSRYCASDGLVLIGDAYAFLDPVFSSGVFFALRSGELAADAVDEALTAGDFSAARFEDYSREMRRGIEAMRRLVYAFYDHDFSFGTFFRTHPEFRGDVTDCLVGDLSKDFDPLFAAVGEFAAIPEALSYGGPLVGAAEPTLASKTA